MATHKIKSGKAAACIIFGCIGLTGMVVFFTLGGIFFSQQHPKVLSYASSICRVDSRSYKSYVCQSRYYTYTCYGPIWEVHYGAGQTIFARVEQETRYRDYRDALSKANEYQINSLYSCWYDTKHPSVAQWNKPSTLIAIILLSCGGLSVLLSVFLFFLAIKLLKQKTLQNGYDEMDPYSQSDPYIKQ